MIPQATEYRMYKNLKQHELLLFFKSRVRCRVNFARGQNQCMPTVVNTKINLQKGDLFAISLTADGSQKLVMQVDEERPPGQMPNSGSFNKRKCLISF
jgi:hypothetical protein